ncbi:MAG: hypothetical protein AAGD05_17880 [Bacteroidota bacterium]
MKSNTPLHNGLWEGDLVKVLVGLPVLLFVTLLLAKGYTEAGVRLVIRWSARIDVFFFCIVFGADALHLWMRNSLSFWLRMNQYYWGLAFAILHLVHLVFLGLLQWSFHPVFERAASISLVAGVGAYVFLILLFLPPITGAKRMAQSLAWRRLYELGMHWIWLVFMSSYWKRVLNVDLNYWPLAVLLVFVFGMRAWFGNTSTGRKAA